MARESRGLNAENTRAVSGLLAVVIGDTTIALAAILGISHFPPTGGAQGSENLALFAAILSSAFTAIGTMTTAYFGIKSISNTAQALRTAAPAATPPGPATPQAPDPGQGPDTSPAQ